MQPFPKQGKVLFVMIGLTFLPFSGHNPDLVSKFPFFNMIIQNCHGFDESLTSQREPRYSSFSTAYLSGLL
jgi:hypothetical protein